MKIISLLFPFLLLAMISFGQESVSNGNPQIEAFLKKKNALTKKTNYGVYYSIEKTGSGVRPKKGDYVMVHFKGKTLDGKVFDESKRNEPFVFKVGERHVIRGWDVGITLLDVGSKGTLYLPPNLAYGKTGVGKAIPPNAPLIFELELLKILTAEEYDQFMDKIEERERQAYEAEERVQFQQDLTLIKQYAKNNKLKIKKLPSGVSYMLKKKGKGPAVKAGDQLTVHYEGRLTDNTVFQKTFGGSPFKFKIGKEEVIKGWDEGFKLFKKGSQGWILIPSKLAYGQLEINEGKINIPENSVLIFKVKVMKVN